MIDPKHPVWKTINLVVACTIIMGLVLVINASSIDQTEWTALSEFAAVLLGWKLIAAKVTKK